MDALYSFEASRYVRAAGCYNLEDCPIYSHCRVNIVSRIAYWFVLLSHGMLFIEYLNLKSLRIL
jgi:hypothetical protein